MVVTKTLDNIKNQEKPILAPAIAVRLLKTENQFQNATCAQKPLARNGKLVQTKNKLGIE